MIRILLDISVLGRGLIHSCNRTGIHRVTLELAKGLASHPEVELSLCCSSPSAWRNSREAALQVPELATLPFMIGSGARFASRILGAMASFGRRKLRHPRFQSGWRKVIGRSERLIHRTASPLDEALAHCDVYLSPYDPLPSNVVHCPRLLILHDIIPLLFPHLSGEQGTLRRILGSLRPSDTVLTISECTKSDVSQWGAKADHLQVVPLFVDPLLFRPDADPQRDAQHRSEIGLSRAPYLLAVGNVEPRKNLSAVLAAFTQIASLPEYQDYQLVLAGAQSPMTENLLAPVPSALLSRIHFTGRVAEHHLGALYRGASVFLFPSLYEGFGLPVLEAMQCGVPVITSNVASLPEVAGEAALLVPPDKPEILALAIRQILSTPELAEQMRHKGLERAQQFTTQAFVHEVVQAAQKARARA